MYLSSSCVDLFRPICVDITEDTRRRLGQQKITNNIHNIKYILEIKL
jgi:hypothetical protein